jgi:hypothetical protein
MGGGLWSVRQAVAPISALAVRRPEFRPLAALLWHQTEEWVWPGSFLPWINRSVLGSGQDEFPIDRRLGFIINVVLGWGGSLAATKPSLAAAPVTALYVSHFGNAALHVSWAVRHRRYDPGVVTAVAALAPAATGRASPSQGGSTGVDSSDAPGCGPRLGLISRTGARSQTSPAARRLSAESRLPSALRHASSLDHDR